MLNIAVVDDLREDRERLARDIRAYFDAAGIEMDCRLFGDAAAFMRAQEAKPFQLAFLDICMEGMDGIALSRLLRARDARMMIVFVSTSREYAFDAFPVHPFDYLVKPYPAQRLAQVLDEALRAGQGAEPELEVRIPHGSLNVAVDLVSAIVAHDHAVEVVLTDGRRLRSIMTFGELAGQLEGDGRFLSLNRGVLVNMDDALTLQGESMRMKTGDVYPFRTRGRAALVSRFTQYQIGRMRKGSRG